MMVDFASQLYYAIEDENNNELQRLIDNGADVNQVYDGYSHRKTILHFACGKGRTKCVEVLLENGASVNTRDKWRMPPLMYCITTQNFYIAKMLIQKDPKTVDAQDMHGRTCLHLALNDASESAVEFLLRMGSDVNVQNFNGITPLMLLMASKETANYLKLMKMLTDAGADVNVQGFRDNRTSLHLAVISKKVDAVELLLKLNADPNHMDTGGKTPLLNLLSYHIPLHRTTSQFSDDVMTIAVVLMQAGTDINMFKTEYTQSSCPLILAANARCPQLVRLFLQYGADVNVRLPYSGVTPLLTAVKQNDFETVVVLMEWNCQLNVPGKCRFYEFDYDPFELAVHNGSWDIVNFLILHGYDATNISYLQDICSENIPDSLKNNKQILNFLRKYASTPKMLVQCCTLTIFKTIRSDIANKIALLPLPMTLKNLIKNQYFYNFVETISMMNPLIET